MKRSLLVSLSLTVAISAACSDDKRDNGPARDGGPRDVATAVPDSGEPDGGADLPDAASTRDPSCPAAAKWITSVSGGVAGEASAPVAGSKAQLCVHTAPAGMLLCLRPADTGADGRFAIPVSNTARCVTDATMRLFHPTEDRGVSYCALDLSSGAEALDITAPYRLYRTARATMLPPLGDATMSRTVRFGDGLEMDLVPMNYFPGAGAYTDLAAGPVPAMTADACALAGEPRFDGIYALTPEGDITMGRAALRLPNNAQLAANTPVRVFALGGLGCTLDDGTLIPEGEWAELEPTAVSADGTTIPVTPGVPCLSWVAYRAQ